jgi:5-methylcytosine-specific restriction endonuclease McrA
MRFGIPYNRGRAATIEHVSPLSDGGTWALDNLRLCHVGCNRHLGANTPEQKERMRIGKARRV